MKLEKKKIDVLGNIGISNKEATISVKDMPKLWEMLQNPYKNSIGSIVREITSNCFDSHAEAGITDAVRIKISRDESGYYISFIDVGVGLSEDRIDTIYRQYLKSTKEDSNEFIGAFGLGSKSPLSYQDIFYINTIFDGVEYNYFMRKGEDMPVISLMEQKETTERNGTEIKIYIKNEADLWKFVNECSEQLMFFDNIVYDLDNIIDYFTNLNHHTNINLLTSLLKLKKDFVLVQGKTFIFNSSYNNLSTLHLSIGNVKYPIDWSNLGINAIQVPVALKFDIGELQVIQTREDVRYTDANIEVIKNRINKFKDELLEIYNNKSNEVNDLGELITNYSRNNYSYLTFKNEENADILYERSINLNGLVDFQDLHPPTVKDFKYKFKDLGDTLNFVSLLQENTTKLMANKIVRQTYGDNYDGPFYIKTEKGFNKGGALKTLDGIRKNPGHSWDTSYIGGTFIGQNSIDQLSEVVNKYFGKYKIFLTKEKKYTTKKNKFILEKMFGHELYPEDVIILSKFTFNPSIKQLYKSIKKYYSDTLKKEEYKEIINTILNYVKVQLSNIKTYDYDNLKVDEKWWKDRQSASRNIVEYDRSLMAIEKANISEYTSTISYDRTDYRPTIEEYITKKDIRVLLDKNEESHLVSNAHTGATFFEKLIIELLKYSGKKLVGSNISIHLTKTRNYNNILKYRKEDSNIYTYKEFITNEKIWKRMISKLVTSIKIKNYVENNLIIDNFGEFSNKQDIFNLLFRKEIRDDYQQLIEYLSFRHHFNQPEIEQFIKEADAINNKFQIYDLDIINKFNKLLPLFRDHNLHLVKNNVRDVFKFTNNYKPSQSKLALQSIYSKPLTEKSLVDYLKERGIETNYDGSIYDENGDLIPGSFDINIKKMLPSVLESNGYYRNDCKVKDILFLKYFNQIQENKITI